LPYNGASCFCIMFK